MLIDILLQYIVPSLQWKLGWMNIDCKKFAKTIKRDYFIIINDYESVYSNKAL